MNLQAVACLLSKTGSSAENSWKLKTQKSCGSAVLPDHAQAEILPKAFGRFVPLS